jgi:predicted dehydrogenase
MNEPEDPAFGTDPMPTVAVPELDYRPPRPAGRHRIALVGAGGISSAHLDAYRSHGFEVTVICSRDAAKAKARRDEFFPRAEVMTDYTALLWRRDIDVVDLTPHPAERTPMIEAALTAGKHVLSQKPFVTDLDVGQRICDLAEAMGLKLAVNQNGRWAPHMAWMRAAVQAGLIGDVHAAHVGVHWDHRWIKGTPFEAIEDIVLYDFGLHWFDFVTSIMGGQARSVQAQVVRARQDGIGPPLLASVLVDYGQAQASLIFDACTPHGPLDASFVAGTLGSLSARGPDLGQQQVTLTTATGRASPVLEGTWFNDGFAGAMGALLCAIETDRPPANDARGNLDSLALCFAAIAASRQGCPVVPGSVRQLPSQTVELLRAGGR